MNYEAIVSTASAAFSGGSVLFAVQVYKRTTFKENISLLRRTVEAASQSVGDVEDLLTERYTSQYGARFAEYIASVYGPALTSIEIAEIFANTKNDNFFLQALYEAFERTDVARRLEDSKTAVAAAVTNTRRFAPITAQLIQKIGAMILNSVSVAYSVGHLKNNCLDSENRASAVKYISNATTTSLAYSEFGDYVGGVISRTCQEHSLRIAHEEVRIFSLISERILSLSESEVSQMVKLEDGGLFDREKFESIETRTSSLRYLFDRCKKVFSENQRETISSSLGRIEGYLKVNAS